MDSERQTMCTYTDHLCSGLWFACSCVLIDYKSHSMYKWLNQKTKEFHHQMHSTPSDSWQSLAQKKQWIDLYVCMRVCMCVLCTCAVYVRVTGKKCFCISHTGYGLGLQVNLDFLHYAGWKFQTQWRSAMKT